MRLTCKHLNWQFKLEHIPLTIREYRIGIWQFQHTENGKVFFDDTPALNRRTLQQWTDRARHIADKLGQLTAKEEHRKLMAGKLTVIDGTYAKFPKVDPPWVDRSHIKEVAA